MLVWIPEGDCPQDKEHYDTPDLPYTPSQDHVSQWDRAELTNLGLRCSGVGRVSHEPPHGRADGYSAVCGLGAGKMVDVYLLHNDR